VGVVLADQARPMHNRIIVDCAALDRTSLRAYPEVSGAGKHGPQAVARWLWCWRTNPSVSFPRGLGGALIPSVSPAQRDNDSERRRLLPKLPQQDLACFAGRNALSKPSGRAGSRVSTLVGTAAQGHFPRSAQTLRFSQLEQPLSLGLTQ